ncbi:MAG: hypothetical protein H7Y20_02670, partial [Bryobacteraceae bacterium]|nr:hypothetical protein [Bryobacteraceae bacterium]
MHPTYAVRDGEQPEIDVSYGPYNVTETFTIARDLGLKIRLEPHLDWQQTLSGGAYEWRRRMYINPAGRYFEQILAPLAQLKPDEFTLGSELDVSSYEFSKE